MAKDYKIQIIINAKDLAGKTLSGVGKNLQTVGVAALGAAGIVTGALAGIGAGITKLAIDAAPVATVRAAFEGLAESAGASADDLLGALKKGSAGMVAQSDLMESFNKAAQLVGMDFAQTLPNAMGFLGKVAGATGQDLDYMLDSLVTGVGRLSPMILDNLGVQVNLTEANEAYAKSIGKTVGKLTKSEQQTALMNQVMMKLEENTASMPDVAGTAAAGIAGLQARFKDTKDTIGVAFLPVLTDLMGTFGNLADRVLPPLMEFIETTLVPLFEDAAFFVDSFVGALLAGEGPIDALTGALSDLGLEDVAMRVETIGEKIGEFITRAQETLQPIIDWVMENVELKDILIALGIAVATIVIPAVISLISALAPVLAIIAAVIAVVTLLRMAWENDFLGIRTALTEFWEGTAKPALSQLWAWLQEKIPEAIETLKGFWENTLVPAMERVGEAIKALAAFWENTLLPAIQTIWEFIQENVIPVLTALGELVDAVVTLAFEVLAALWENVLYPALEKIWKFIQDKVMPILSALADVVKNILGPPLETLTDKVLPALEKAFGAVVDILGKAKEFVWGLVNAIKEIDLPRWLEPGSPTPFEYALVGIADAMQDVALSANVMGGALAMSMPGGGGGGSADNRAYSDTYNTTINDTDTGALFMALVDERQRNRFNEYMGVN